MSSEEDDMPLLKRNGKRSSDVVTSAMEREAAKFQGNVDDKDLALEIPLVDVEMTDAPPVRGQRRARKAAIKEEESDEDDMPLTKRRKVANGVKKEVESDDDDVPLTARRKANGAASKKKAVKKEEDSDASDVPLAAKKLAKVKKEIEKDAAVTAKKIRAAESKQKKKVKKEESESESDAKPKAKKAAAKAQTNGAKKAAERGKAVKKEAAGAPDDDPDGGGGEEEFKWWEEQGENDGKEKWKTLEHNGVLFPPPYEPLPPHVKLIYDGIPVTMHPNAEEVAGFYGSMLNSEVNVSNPKFNANFFEDFQEVLRDNGGARGPDGKKVNITEFEKCNFQQIFDYYEAQREAKRNLPAAEKKRLKAEQEAAVEKYQYCLWDGRKEKVGNFRIEPPGLFRGRGDHPKTGRVKKRVMPEDVTINIGKDAPIPEPPAGHKWGAVKHDTTVTWLATWEENINGNRKYVMLAATSSLKGMSDYKKFEKARELKKHIDKIRRDYEIDMKSKDMTKRQLATVIYLIDKLALRAGNEKGEDEADTVGCCSLRYEHISLKDPSEGQNIVVFDFLGKDSIRYYNEVAVSTQAFKNLKIFKKAPKTVGDMIFDRVSPSSVNKYLYSYMDGLTAKVFRTYNASWTMVKELEAHHDKFASDLPFSEKNVWYNNCNREVAIICNHQRTVPKGHETSVENIENKIKGLKYKLYRVKKIMLSLDPKLKKDKKFMGSDLDLDLEWIQETQQMLLEQQRERIRKKFEKDNEKAVAEGNAPAPASELKEKLKAVDELEKVYKKENKTGKIEPENRLSTMEKCEKELARVSKQLTDAENLKEDKEANKTVALGTSKINYIDPRITVMFCKKYDIPVEKMFNKTLREKFKWAIESADANWEF